MAACGFESRATDGSGSSKPDAPTSSCEWAAHFDACTLPPLPPNPLTLTASTPWKFDTHGNGMFMGTMPPATTFVARAMPQRGGGQQVVVLYTSAFTLDLGATLIVTGDKPLVIASNSTITINGLLDAGSRTGSSPNQGPGANYGCATDLSGSNNNDGGGGGGGALAANGGAGGDGNGTNSGKAGTSVPMPAVLRAGCPGGKGGRNGGTGGIGGDGGGAIELAARLSIVVNGSINAGGEGGGSGQQPSGGGGGGSGGIIRFDSPSVTFASSAIVAANGGGGGGGASDDSQGQAGSDALVGITNAAGGSGGAGHNGGDGGAASSLGGGGGGGGDGGGGGGGGGSSGYILVYARSFAFAGAVVSPPPIQP